MALKLLTCFLICFLASLEVDAFASDQIRRSFNYYGVLNMWKTFTGSIYIEDYVQKLLAAKKVCYTKNEDYVGTLTNPSRRRHVATVPRQPQAQDGTEAEAFFNQGYEKMIRPIMSNVTCMLHQIGYINDDLRPNYSNYLFRANALQNKYPMVKQDLVDGYHFCQNVSMNYPDTHYVPEQFSILPLETIAYVNCVKEVQLYTNVKYLMFDDYYELKDYYDDASDVWGGDTITKQGIHEFFFSMQM